MRRLAMVGLLAATIAAEGDRAAARAEAHLKRGREAVARLAEAKSNAQKLHALERARHFLERAEAIAAKDAVPEHLRAEIRADLVGVLIRTAAVHYERKSLRRARETVTRALKLDPLNAKAKALLAAIHRAEEEDIFDSVDGIVGIDRVRARRLAVGAPLRDRGRARRR
jgi:hypothetical protein